jgi:hypothetical protein
MRFGANSPQPFDESMGRRRAEIVLFIRRQDIRFPIKQIGIGMFHTTYLFSGERMSAEKLAPLQRFSGARDNHRFRAAGVGDQSVRADPSIEVRQCFENA